MRYLFGFLCVCAFLRPRRTRPERQRTSLDVVAYQKVAVFVAADSWLSLV